MMDNPKPKGPNPNATFFIAPLNKAGTKKSWSERVALRDGKQAPEGFGPQRLPFPLAHDDYHRPVSPNGSLEDVHAEIKGPT